jgi:hypothetical protein
MLCAISADSIAEAIEKALKNPKPETDFSAKLAGNNQAVLQRLKELL